MSSRLHRVAFAIGVAVWCSHILSAQIFSPVPIPAGAYGTSPYHFTGLIATRVQSGTYKSGSGAVARNPKIVITCAHGLFDETIPANPWISEVRWYLGWSSGGLSPVSAAPGVRTRGYFYFTGYSSLKQTGDGFPLDFAVLFSFENLANGGSAAYWTDGLAALQSSRVKLITGYPTGLYNNADSRKYLMHATGPFTREFDRPAGSYLEVDGVVAPPGNSGGPVWVSDGNTYGLAGVVVAGAENVARVGVYGIGSAATLLMDEAIAATTPPPGTGPEITRQPTSARVALGSNVSFSVAASGPNLTYQWLFNGNPISGATSPTYALTRVIATQAGSYQVSVRNSLAETRSLAATLIVDGPAASIRPTGPVPANQSATLSITPVAGFTYQWQVSIDNGQTWTFLGNTSTYANVTTPALTIRNVTVAMSGFQYRVVLLSNPSGVSPSTVVTLNVSGLGTNADGGPVLLRDTFSLNSAAGRTVGTSLDGRPVEASASGQPQWSSTDLYQGGSNTFEGDAGTGYITASSGHSSALAALPATVTGGRIYYLRARIHPGSVGVMASDADPLPGYLSLGFYRRASGGYIGDDTRVVDFVMFKTRYTVSTAAQDLIGSSHETYPAYPGGTPNWSAATPALVRVEWDTFENSLSATINGVTVLNRFFLPVSVRPGEVRFVGFARDYNLDATSVVDDFEFGEVARIRTTPPTTGRLSNLSVRTSAGSGSQTLIVGFAVGGTGGKQLLVRGIGPTLAQFGVTGALADPALTLVNTAGATLQRTASWGGTSALSIAFSSVGAFALPPASRDAAFTVLLQPAPYTAQLTSVSNSAGVALVEAYDLESPLSSARLTNLSARSQVVAGSTLIAGFALTGATSRQILIRAVGPTLAGFEVGDALPDPMLTLFSGSGSRIQENDNWGGSSALSTAFSSVGAFPLPTSSRDSALIATLAPGSYTVHVSGAGNTSGVALVEIYELP